MAREKRSLKSDLERWRVGCFRVDPGRDPRELAERRVKAGEAGGKTPERRSSGLGGM